MTRLESIVTERHRIVYNTRLLNARAYMNNRKCAVRCLPNFSLKLNMQIFCDSLVYDLQVV